MATKEKRPRKAKPETPAPRDIVPVGSRIILKQKEAEEKTAGGIVLPEQAKEKPQEGRVTAVGEEVSKVEVGQNVFFASYAGTEMEIDERKVLLMDEADVLAILK